MPYLKNGRIEDLRDSPVARTPKELNSTAQGCPRPADYPGSAPDRRENPVRVPQRCEDNSHTLCNPVRVGADRLSINQGGPALRTAVGIQEETGYSGTRFKAGRISVIHRRVGYVVNAME
jgi:hypothetical protein